MTIKERLQLAAEIAKDIQGINPNVKYDLELHISKAIEMYDEQHPSQDVCLHPSNERVINQDGHEYCDACKLHFDE